jgi:hypothetical protein
MAKRPPPQAVMLNFIIGHWLSRLIYVAAELRLADLLKSGPRTVDSLAKEAGVQVLALYRILRALASIGVFAETTGQRFKLTPLAATLQTGPGSLRASALAENKKYAWDAWLQLLHGVKTGENPFLKAHGLPAFEYLQQHPEDLQLFGEYMTSVSSAESPAVTAAYKFSKFRTLVDVAGGHGSMLATILKANPKLKGVLFDLPAVIVRAGKDHHVTAKGIAKRCTLAGGDVFESVPKGGDAYIMKHIIHDWDDEQSVKILTNCRVAMNENGKVLVVDNVIAPGNDPAWGKLLDVAMLTYTGGGRERTTAEFAALFKQAGLKLTRVVTTKCPLSIVEGVRA